MSWKHRCIGVAAVAAALSLAWQLWAAAQAPPDRSRFAFRVVESYDAQYLGDQPGHIGLGGGLGRLAPNIALDDPVYRDNTKVGKVARLVWNEAKESLLVEFDAEPGQRIYVGEEVWITLGEAAPARR